MGEPKKKLRRPAARTEQSEQEDPEKKVQQEKEQGVVVDSRDAPEERHDAEEEEKQQGGSSELLNEKVLRKFTRTEHDKRFKTTKTVLDYGTYSHVRREYDTQDGVLVALKVPNSSAPNMQQEIAIMKTFAQRCVNLVHILGVVVSSRDGGARPRGILMECCPQSLNDYWLSEVGLVGADVRRKCLSHMLRGLSYLHATEIVHLDICPNNILMLWHAWSGLLAKIADFGCAHFLAPDKFLTSTEKVTTLQYRAPEVALGLPFNHAADMWAVGVVARELATGRRVYEELPATVQVCTDIVYINLLAGPVRNSTWPGVESAPRWQAPPCNLSPDSDEQTHRAPWFDAVSLAGVRFARELLSANPRERPAARTALQHRHMAFGQIRAPRRLRQKVHLGTPVPAARCSEVSLAGGVVAGQAVPAAPCDAVSLAGGMPGKAVPAAPCSAVSSAGGVGQQAEPERGAAAHAEAEPRRCACHNTCRQPMGICGSKRGRKKIAAPP